jgi:hypothetical protein
MSQNKLNYFYTIIILIAGTLVFPLFFFTPHSNFKTVQILFSLPTISSLCLVTVFLKLGNLKSTLFKYKLALFSSLLFLLIPTIQFFIYKSYSFSDWSFSILWISIPLFAYIFYDNLKSVLPIYLFCFWIIDIIYSTFQTGQIVGIVGNRNWHAVFLIVLVCFLLYLFYSFYKKTDKTSLRILICTMGIILTLYTFVIIYLCESRGAWVSLAITMLIFIIIKLYNNSLNRYIKYSIAAVSICVILLAISIFTYSFFSVSSSTLSNNIESSEVLKSTALEIKNINNSLDSDVRTPLWLGCINLIEDYPIIGVGTARFESVYAGYRPISYFAKPLSAVRSNHPHNTLLYIAACYGLIGLILWLILWLYPVLYCIAKYKDLALFKKVALFSYICLFIHGMLDLIFFEWPTLFIAGILIGILWTEPWKPICENIKSLKQKKNIYLNILIKAVAVILLIMTIKTVYNDYMSSYNFRYGRLIQSERREYEALYFYNKGLKYYKTPKYLYKAATTALLKLRDPMLALKYLDDFKNISTFDYAHKNSFIALALLILNRPKPAMPYLIKAVINYPLLTGNWYRLATTQRRLGMMEASQISIDNMYKTMKYKNLPKSALKLLLTNPNYDSHPQRIPKEKLEQLTINN